MTQSVDSPHSKRAYGRTLVDFLDWYDGNGRPGFTKATINAYLEEMLQSGLAGASMQKVTVSQGISGVIAAILPNLIVIFNGYG